MFPQFTGKRDMAMKRILVTVSTLSLIVAVQAANGQVVSPQPAYGGYGSVQPVAYMQAGCNACGSGACGGGCVGDMAYGANTSYSGDAMYVDGCVDGSCGAGGYDVCGDCGTACGGGCGTGSGLFGGRLGGLFGGRLGGGLMGGGNCSPSRLWFNGEYLLWWTRARYLPPLVTTSPNGTLMGDAGVIGQPGTSILFGGSEVDDSPTSGYRFGGGWWFNSNQTIGIGGRYFHFGDESVDFAASSPNGDPILARPFYDAATDQESSLLISYPAFYSGSVQATASNEIEGGDVYLRGLLIASHGNRLDLIGGYTYSLIEDSVVVGQTVLHSDPAGRFPIGTTQVAGDYFDTENEFHGGHIGLMSESEDGCLTWRFLAKVAFGNMNRTVSIRGVSTTTAPGGAVATTNAEGGLLAQPTNIGVYESDDFVVMPEAMASVGYKLTNNLQLTLGYSFLYWSKVQMAGDAIDTTVNSSQFGGVLNGPARPAFTPDTRSVWAQGINLGLNLRY